LTDKATQKEQPIEKIRPSKPLPKTSPGIPIKDAADIYSPVIAKPFRKPVMPPPAV